MKAVLPHEHDALAHLPCEEANNHPGICIAARRGDAAMKVEIGGNAFIRPRGCAFHFLEGFGDTSEMLVMGSQRRKRR
jgi:hypothetical protein